MKESGAKLRYWSVFLLLAVVPLIAANLPLGKKKDAIQYGAGLIVNVPLPEAEVLQAVQDVAQNGLIRGTKEYNKDEFISGATMETSSHLFPPWTEGGKVLYKQRTHAIDPRNFKDSGDTGTLTVRYVIQGLDEKSTVLRIDAMFVEDFRRTAHPSNGSVEGAEYKDIHDHLESSELMKKQTTEAELEKQQRRDNASPSAVKPEWSSSSGAPKIEELSAPDPANQPLANDSPAAPESLDQQLKNLRHQVERLVKAPGAPLKSAPFHTASTLKSLTSGTEVLIVINSPYWYGVETHAGDHGWISRDELEPLP